MFSRTKPDNERIYKIICMLIDKFIIQSFQNNSNISVLRSCTQLMNIDVITAPVIDAIIHSYVNIVLLAQIV